MSSRRLYEFGVGYTSTLPTEAYGIVSPKQPPPTTRPGIIACHSSTMTGALICHTSPDWVPHMNVLGEHFHIHAPDLINPQNWGVSATDGRVTDAYAHLQARRGVRSDKVFLFFLSMGALAALNWARANASKVAAMVGLIPVCNLKDAHDNRGFASLIDSASAYGSHANYVSAEPTRNPAATGNQAALAGIPLLLGVSENDPAADPTVDRAYATALNAVGGNATVVSLGSVGHSASSFDSNLIVDVLMGHLP